ncbi:Hypothetical protein LUCI_1463 [Lucifera butyrica]|uniref:Uncharacterized protein n=1 Tax=Lucifera butyrica TaxID=1351585 RepID=A0A498R553_9FIRM|nr:Hypothetical protein LUCI_1463 [Lucifera butyrica]
MGFGGFGRGCGSGAILIIVIIILLFSCFDNGWSSSC